MNPHVTAAATPASWFWQSWLATVIFVFPIPHTIALRNLILVTGLLVLLATWQGAMRLRPARALRPAAWGLVATTAWLVLQSVAVAPLSTVALENLRGDWLTPLLTGTLAAFAAARLNTREACRVLFMALLAHMLWVLGWQLWLLITTGAVGDGSQGIVPFGERDYQSSLSGFLLAIVLAERASAVGIGPQAAVFSGTAGWVVLAVSFAAETALRTRNGVIVSTILVATTALWLVRLKPRLLAVLLAAAILAGTSITLDARWSGLKESLAIGWNSPSLYWMSWDPLQRPPTPSGALLEESAYARAAWGHQALLAIGENPLGLGFGRDGFGRAIEQKFGFRGLISSHSGWLDFALGAGLPGLALLLLSAGLAMRGGWRHFRVHDDAAGLMLSFLVGAYTLRCLLDGHLSGWRLGLFAFICGLLVAAMKRPPADR